MDINGKVAVVTGGADGIGKAIVGTLLERGAKGVLIADVDVYNNGGKTADEYQKVYGSERVIFRKCDVTRQEDMEYIFHLVMSTYGQLNIVCNNAGICDEIEWEKTLHVNLHGVIRGTKLAIEHLDSSEANRGVIINIASEAALVFYQSMPVYSASKMAILGYTRYVAHCDPDVQEKHIRLNTVCPTAVGTNLLRNMICLEPVPDGKEIAYTRSPQDVANAVLRLIEEDHHGQSIHIPSEGEAYLLKDDQLVPKEVVELPIKASAPVKT